MVLFKEKKGRLLHRSLHEDNLDVFKKLLKLFHTKLFDALMQKSDYFNYNVIHTAASYHISALPIIFNALPSDKYQAALESATSNGDTVLHLLFDYSLEVSDSKNLTLEDYFDFFKITFN